MKNEANCNLLEKPKFTCELCGETFVKYWNGTALHRFCGTRCRNKHIASLKVMVKGRKCPICGNVGYERNIDTCSMCLGLKWTDTEVTYLREHYPNEGAEQVATSLGKTLVQVRDKANTLHIRLTKEATHRIVHSAAQQFMRDNNPMKRKEVKAKIAQWRNEHPEEVARITEKLRIGHQQIELKNPSKLEYRLREMLESMGISYTPSFLVNGKFVVDIRINELIVQADGDYWHGHPRFEPLTERQISQQKRDRSHDSYLKACGYSVVRIWESDLTQDLLCSILKQFSIITQDRYEQLMFSVRSNKKICL